MCFKMTDTGLVRFRLKTFCGNPMVRCSFCLNSIELLQIILLLVCVSWISAAHGGPLDLTEDIPEEADLWVQYREGEITWEEYLWEKEQWEAEQEEYQSEGARGPDKLKPQNSHQQIRSRITPVDKRGESQQSAIPNQTDHHHTLHQWESGSLLDLQFGWSYDPEPNDHTAFNTESAGITLSNRSLHFSTPPMKTAGKSAPPVRHSNWKLSMGNTGSKTWRWPRMIYDSKPAYLWSSPQSDWNGLMVQHRHLLGGLSSGSSGASLADPNHSLQFSAGFWRDDRRVESTFLKESAESALSAGALEIELYQKRRLIAMTGFLFPFCTFTSQNSVLQKSALQNFAEQFKHSQMVVKTSIAPWKTDLRVSGNRSGSAAIKYAKRTAESSVSMRGDWISPGFHHPWYPFWYSNADTVDGLWKAPGDNWFSLYSRWRQNLGVHWNLSQVYRIRPHSETTESFGNHPAQRHYLSQKLTGKWKQGPCELPLKAELRARNSELMEDPSAWTLRLRSEIQFQQNAASVQSANHARTSAKVYALRAGIESAPGIWGKEAVPGAELSLRVSEGLNHLSQELEFSRLDFADREWKWYSRLKWVNRWKSGWQGTLEWALSLSFCGTRRESMRLRIVAELEG